MTSPVELTDLCFVELELTTLGSDMLVGSKVTIVFARSFFDKLLRLFGYNASSGQDLMESTIKL